LKLERIILAAAAATATAAAAAEKLCYKYKMQNK
jgi:hypothetical protein